MFRQKTWTPWISTILPSCSTLQQRWLVRMKSVVSILRLPDCFWTKGMIPPQSSHLSRRFGPRTPRLTRRSILYWRKSGYGDPGFQSPPARTAQNRLSQMRLETACDAFDHQNLRTIRASGSRFQLVAETTGARNSVFARRSCRRWRIRRTYKRSTTGPWNDSEASP